MLELGMFHHKTNTNNMLLHKYQPHGRFPRKHSYVIDSESLSANTYPIFNRLSGPTPGPDVWLNDYTDHPEVYQIDLVSLSRQVGGDILAFFEMLEDKGNYALFREAANVEITGLKAAISELAGDANAEAQFDLNTSILSRVDELRKFGELCLPVFNVSVK